MFNFFQRRYVDCGKKNVNGKITIVSQVKITKYNHDIVKFRNPEKLTVTRTI